MSMEHHLSPTALFLNLTNHPILYRSHTGEEFSWQKSLEPARLTAIPPRLLREESQTYGLSICTKSSFNGVVGLPADKSINIIVEPEVAQTMHEYHIPWIGVILSADTSDEAAIYNENGALIGCKRFCLHTPRIQEPL